MTSMTKSALRKKFRELCRQLSPAYREKAAQAAAKRLVTLPIFKHSQRIACYLSTKQEFDSSPIIEAIWQAKKQCYVPIVVSEENEKILQFEQYQYGDALHLNRYSILEPIHTTRRVAPDQLELVLLPVIAFDCYGHRLGTGGGYYDRTFAFLHGPVTDAPRMVGLAYTVQQIDLLPSDPWDIVLNDVLTESEFIHCSDKKA